LVTMLGVPPQEIWQMIPGTTKDDIDRWKATVESGDAFKQLSAILERQNANGNQPAPAPVA